MENQSNFEFNMSNNHTYDVSIFPPEVLRLGAIGMSIFTIVGVAGNFISILALLRCKKIWNATTTFIINLCLADFFLCSFTIPLIATMFFEKKWPYSAGLCKVLAFVKAMNAMQSPFIVLAITFNRFIMIVHSKIYSLLYTKRKMIIWIFIIWGVPFAILLLPLFEIWGILGYDPKELNCTIQERPGESPRIFIVITFFVIPSILFIGCYTKIYFVVRKATRRVRREENEIGAKCTCDMHERNHRSEGKETCSKHHSSKDFRLPRMLLVMFLQYILCYFPFSFFRILNKKNDYPLSYMITGLFLFFSNVVNPVIYVVMSKEYRKAYKNLFACKQRGSLQNSGSNLKTSSDVVLRTRNNS